MLYEWPGLGVASTRRSLALGRMLSISKTQGRHLFASFGLITRRELSGQDSAGKHYAEWRERRAAAPKVELPRNRQATLQPTLDAYRTRLIQLVEAGHRHDVEVVMATQPMLYSEHMLKTAQDLWWSGALGAADDPDAPYLTEAALHRSLKRFNDVTRQVARDYGAVLVDLDAAMTEGQTRFYYDAIHFNNEGARRAGELVGAAIARKIESTGDSPDLCRETITFPSSVSPEIRRLHARVAYRRSWRGRRHPISVVMHGFAHDSSAVIRAMNFARARGFFAVAPEMRGRGDSDGAPDCGGLEIWDIVDAVDQVRAKWAGFVDPDRVIIEGFSGGGGNVLSALTRFPELWSTGICWFGISDYGLDPETGWYHQTTAERRQKLRQLIGDPDTPQGRRAYAARASYLGAANNALANIHLFVEREETACPPIQSQQFVEAAESAGLKNVTLHLGDAGRWQHGYPDWETLRAAHRMVWPNDRPRRIPAPPDDTVQRWMVLGTLKTRDLHCRLGNGTDAVARLERERLDQGWRFSVRFEHTPPAAVHLELFTKDGPTEYELTGANGHVHQLVAADGVLTLPPLEGDQELVLRRR
ncbi:MAG: prolyl oligopeptidase family serine peptidase [bacterium]|nr:prolyl oligopeptidase family serine peptidase [bacterium]